MADRNSSDSGDAVFRMDPDVTLRELARQLVSGHRALAEIARSADKLRQAADPADPAAQELLSQFDATRREWITRTTPAIAASMQLALEVYDTFGPGPTVIDDRTEAAIWNNKWFVAEHDYRRVEDGA